MSMNWIVSFFVLLVCVAALMSCATSGKTVTNFQEKFDTEISPDGTKIFNYNLISDRANVRSSNGSHNGHRGNRSESDFSRGSPAPDRGFMGGINRETFDAKLNAMLEQTSFCRDGYVEIESHFFHATAEIRGECKEGASDEDRKKFAK